MAGDVQALLAQAANLNQTVNNLMGNGGTTAPAPTANVAPGGGQPGMAQPQANAQATVQVPFDLRDPIRSMVNVAHVREQIGANRTRELAQRVAEGLEVSAAEVAVHQMEQQRYSTATQLAKSSHDTKREMVQTWLR